MQALEALTAAECHQHTGWLRCEAENTDILALSKRGVAIKEIMRRTDKSRRLVRQVVRGGRDDIFRSRMSSLDRFLAQLETTRTDVSQNGAALWRAKKTKGFTGGLRVVTEWATRKRKDEGTATRDKRSSKTPSARRIARPMPCQPAKRLSLRETGGCGRISRPPPVAPDTVNQQGSTLRCQARILA
jgi:hypothetical protein